VYVCLLVFISTHRDVSNCEVVTAWAGGCTWTEALQISGLPPGDLARTLSRSLDGLRQLGNLPFRPIRRGDYISDATSSALLMPQGIHPEVRRLCRDAAQSINRYPVKDALVFVASDEEDDFDQEVLEEEEEEEKTKSAQPEAVTGSDPGP
jgi:DSHCT (NUC185) domain